MKILKLLEAKFAKPEYAYHATKAVHLKSILTHGLIPNKEEGGYGSDEEASAGYALTSLPGVYFARDYRDAVYISRDLYGPSIIVVAKIQTRDSELDEDRLVTNVIKESKISQMVRKIYKEFDYNFDEYGDEIEDRLDSLIHTKTEEIIAELTTVFKMDARAISNVMEDIHNYVRAVVDIIPTDEYEQNDPHEVKEYQNILTKKLKSIQHHDLEHKFTTFKINKPIGYSGANKIVGFVCPATRKYWGDMGDALGPLIRTKHPMEIIK
jgi:hypothetical protein